MLLIYGGCVQTLVSIEGVPEDLLRLLVAKGYYKTKSEAIRAGIMSLGKEFDMPRNSDELEKALVALKIKSEETEMKAKGKRYLSEAEVRKKYGFR